MKRPIQKDEIRKFKSRDDDFNHLAGVYFGYSMCVGGRVRHPNYRCVHCGSTNPSEECYAPDPDHRQYLEQQGDAWVRKPPAQLNCKICKKLFDNDRVPDRNCGGDCLQCMAEAGDPDCIAELIKWTRSIS